MTAVTAIDVSRLRLCLPPRSPAGPLPRALATTPDVDAMLARNAVVAIGVSGGKDSVAVAMAVARHLEQIGHTGPRILVHADLGRVEWKDSLPACERLAARLGWELLVVRRQAGDMLARWQGRWAANLRRYVELECVKLILPWSTPAMRFCTSELKTAVIASALRKRFPALDIVNVTGIRRQESASRARAPVSAHMTALRRRDAAGCSWNAIIEWKLDDVLQEIADAGLALHEAYTVYGSSRVSCAFCIMSAWDDLVAATTCPDNHWLYIALVELEALSGFGFQGGRWLASVAPHLLSADLLQRVARAQDGAKRRCALEALLPKHLHYTKGWPTSLPSVDEAELIAQVRRGVSDILGVPVKYTSGADVRERYRELLACKVSDDAIDEVQESA